MPVQATKPLRLFGRGGVLELGHPLEHDVHTCIYHRDLLPFWLKSLSLLHSLACVVSCRQVDVIAVDPAASHQQNRQNHSVLHLTYQLHSLVILGNYS